MYNKHDLASAAIVATYWSLIGSKYITSDQIPVANKSKGEAAAITTNVFCKLVAQAKDVIAVKIETCVKPADSHIYVMPIVAP